MRTIVNENGETVAKATKDGTLLGGYHRIMAASSLGQRPQSHQEIEALLFRPIAGFGNRLNLGEVLPQIGNVRPHEQPLGAGVVLRARRRGQRLAWGWDQPTHRVVARRRRGVADPNARTPRGRD